jgi:hypothetical protein
MNQTFTKIGSFSATIISMGQPISGTRNDGTSFTYVPIIAKHSDPNALPVKQSIFVEKTYNKMEDIVVGAQINVVSSKNDITGERNIKTFIGSKFMSVSDMIKLAGGTEEDQQAGATQAKAFAQMSASQRVIARAAARKAALGLPS